MNILYSRRFRLLAGLLLALALTGCSDKGGLSSSRFAGIRDGFITPADTNTVWCYWYWLNDDISKEGVTKDLEAMKAAGIGAAFIGNINPDERDGKVPLFSEAWWETMVHAVTEAKRLGMEIGVFNCPGWSQSGGPWIKPEMAMRHITWSETCVAGGKRVSAKLGRPQELFQDVYVLAVPDEAKRFKTVTADLGKAVRPDAANEFTFILKGRETIAARTLVINPSSDPLRADCELLAWTNGKFEPVRSFVYDRSNHATNVGPDPTGQVAIANPETLSDRFMLTFKNASGNGKSAGITGITLTEEVILDRYVEKSLGKMHPDPFPAWGTYLWDRQVNGKQGDGISTDRVIDISTFMDKEGNLEWDAPAGDWKVMRFGMTLTGTKNSPAAPQGKGYEVDKASSELIRYHFNQYVAELLRRIPTEAKSALKYVIADSYEMGSQNWSDGYAARFIKRYGYDPKKYFPVLAGKVVGSVEESDRFLWDLRRSIADDIAYEYVGGLRKISNENGLKTWLENYGHWGFPSEFLMYGGQSDLIGGEFWTEGTLGNIECKASSSAAHIYGKARTSAESFTAAGNSFSRFPAQLKKRGDWSFTEGVNHVVAHVYIHQPDEQRIPGINAWFSTEFNRHNTWFRQGKAWFDYERRCQHMLQQGKYAADVCYFIGEDAPKMTGTRQPEIPSGYSYDYINAEVILNRLTVRDGKFVLPDGMSYKVMVLPPLKTMRPEVLEKIAALVKAGGTILGPKPEKSPGLKDYPECDQKVKQLADELWGTEIAGTIQRRVGEGYVMEGMSLAQVLEFCRTEPDFNPEGNYPVLWTHRTMPGMDIWFLTNQGNETLTFTPSFRTSGKAPQLWDAVTGKIRLLREFREENGRTFVPVTMEPGRSWFIVFTNHAGKISDEGLTANFPGMRIFRVLEGPWKLDFADKKIGPRMPVTLDKLSDLALSENDSIRYYSGTMTYTSEFDLETVPAGKVYIDLGAVSVIASVKINGSDAGTAWMSPWRLEAGKLLKKGRNDIQVEVANLWRNRLIYDSRLSPGERYTWTQVSDIGAGEAPLSSGLAGPVTLKITDR